MIVGEGATRVLNFLDVEDEEDYDTAKAIEHINQAIHELADDMEIPGLNDFALYDLEAPAVGSEPDYWETLPGRFPLTDITGVALSELSHVRKLWIATSGEQIDFDGRDVRELLDEHGDDTGQPSKYAVDGEYLIVRPVPVAGTEYNLRTFFSRTPGTYVAGDEPFIMAQAPYAVIYRACEVASIWNVDDKGAMKFAKLSQRAIDRYALRVSMVGDNARKMETWDG